VIIWWYAMAKAFGETAVQLALDDHRVDSHATVVDADELEDVPLARLRSISTVVT